MNSEIDSLKQAMEQLSSRCEQSELRSQQSEQRYESSERRYHQAVRRLRVQAAAACGVLLITILVSPGNRAALAQGYGVTLQQLATRLTAQEAKTQYMSVGTDAHGYAATTFSRCNVTINNGLGTTSGNPYDLFARFAALGVNGLGNLIIGYNEKANENGFNYGQTVTGSHNLIVGNANSYTSFGGIVAGQVNTISAPLASVTGGWFNTASGIRASISGGANNTASGYASSVSGGSFNTASSNWSSVSGGAVNTASGFSASVSGGAINTASGYVSSVSGGSSNTASGDYASSVSGGASNTQTYQFGWSGGTYHSP